MEHVVQAKFRLCMVCSSGVSLLWFSDSSLWWFSDCIRSGGLAIRRSGGFLSECIDCGSAIRRSCGLPLVQCMTSCFHSPALHFTAVVS